MKTTDEKRVDGFLMPLASQAEELPSSRALRARRHPIIPPVARSSEKKHHMTKSAGLEAPNTRPKVKVKRGSGVKFILIL